MVYQVVTSWQKGMMDQQCLVCGILAVEQDSDTRKGPDTKYSTQDHNSMTYLDIPRSSTLIIP